MDLHKLDQTSLKHLTVETPGPPLVLEERKNEATARSRTRGISSKYRSSTPSAAPGLRRCPATASTLSVSKRAISAERKWPAAPPSLRSPSASAQDTIKKVIHFAPSKLTGGPLPEGLWPSRMRSLSVSFQSDTYSLPVSKREKPVSQALSDCNVRQSSNVALKLSSTARKPTPERKRSPLKGKNAPDQSENSKPGEYSNSRRVDQHESPGRIKGRLPSNASVKSIDLASRISSTVSQGMLKPSLRQMSMPGTAFQNSPSDVVKLMLPDGSREVECGANMIGNNIVRRPKVVSSRLSERTKLVTPVGQPQLCPATPDKTSLTSSSVSRCPSPARTILTYVSSRGVQPSQSRPSTPSRQGNSSTSVLSYMVDIRKGKKVARQIEDVYQLRLLYNTHLQWRYANALESVTLSHQKSKAEKALFDVWRTTLFEQWELVIGKRIAVQQLRLQLKLSMVLHEQGAYLDKWPSLEEDHSCAVSGAINDLQQSTLRIPVTEGAQVDIDTMQAALCSAVDVMMTVGSSIGYVLPKVEGVNYLVSELADVAAKERAILNEFKALLATTTAMQVEEDSLRTHLVQLKQNH